MGKIIQIEVPEWVDSKAIENLKQLIIELLEEKLKRNKVDINLYKLYFALKYPESEYREFSLEEEIKFLENMRKKEKDRAK